MKRFLCVLIYVASTSITWAQTTYDSFTEPHQEIQIAAPEVDILSELNVTEGETVKTDQVLAVLDNGVFEAALKVAEARKNAYGRLRSAQAIEKLRKEKLDRLLPLLRRGSAQQYEVLQAQIELESAKAEVNSARDTLRVDKLEYEKIKAQIGRRTIRSPIDGVVTEIKKDAAELVGGNEAHILTVAQINPLKTTIYVPNAVASRIQPEQTVTVTIFDAEQAQQEGKVTLISPITDASSDTVKVEISIDNAEGKLRSGVKSQVMFEAVAVE